MRVNSLLGSFVVAVGLLQGPASALPLGSQPANDGVPLVQVSGCHRDVEFHWVPELGRSAWHYHRGSSCRPIEVDPPAPPVSVDCHRDVQRHYLPEFDRRVTHRHVGPNCRVLVVE
jgi:hypothetical protein